MSTRRTLPVFAFGNGYSNLLTWSIIDFLYCCLLRYLLQSVFLTLSIISSSPSRSAMTYVVPNVPSVLATAGVDMARTVNTINMKIKMFFFTCLPRVVIKIRNRGAYIALHRTFCILQISSNVIFYYSQIRWICITISSNRRCKIYLTEVQRLEFRRRKTAAVRGLRATPKAGRVIHET